MQILNKPFPNTTTHASAGDSATSNTSTNYWLANTVGSSSHYSLPKTSGPSSTSKESNTPKHAPSPSSSTSLVSWPTKPSNTPKNSSTSSSKKTANSRPRKESTWRRIIALRTRSSRSVQGRWSMARRCIAGCWEPVGTRPKMRSRLGWIRTSWPRKTWLSVSTRLLWASWCALSTTWNCWWSTRFSRFRLLRTWTRSSPRHSPTRSTCRPPSRLNNRPATPHQQCAHRNPCNPWPDSRSQRSFNRSASS